MDSFLSKSTATSEPVSQADLIHQLEEKVARSQREIVTLSQMLLRSGVLGSGEKASQSTVLDDTTRQNMFKTMAMSLHLTRVPVIMRFGYFKRRHQRRLADALIRENLIDEAWYEKTYPQVVQSGLTPAIHFVVHGISAGHCPHPKFANEAML